ncbi:MAG: peptide transporter, partial [Tepidisphaeraceae bacterium]
IILFIEVARRAFTTLKRPEIYVLYYMAGASLIGSGPGAGLIWNQFIVQSESFKQMGLADKIPTWVTPSSPDVLGLRTFFHPAWYTPIGLLILGMFLQRLDHFGLGYVMYRLTSDVEKLPFPMAPVGAQGITALADASGGQETWRWRVFSFGAMLGMVFAAVAYALPAISSAFLSEPISIFPIPFKDLTLNTEDFLPATPMMIAFDLGVVLAGMVLPFWAMVGSFAGMVLCMIANPVLYKTGILHHWAPGVDAITTINSNYLDFYLSFGLGLTAAIAVIGFWHVLAGLLRRKRAVDEQAQASVNWSALFRPPPGRGDISIWVALSIYFFSTVVSILTAYLLLKNAHENNPFNSPVSTTLILVLCFYGFVYTPIISYVSARMEGIIGMSVQVPFVREATFILTGYQGAAIWFAPFPAHNYGAQTLYFRTTELTGTKITSMIKAEAFIFPVVLVATLVFSQFIWRIAPIPSAAFPFAAKMWEPFAFRQATIFSSTLPGGEHGPFYEAFSVLYIGVGLGLALLTYVTLSFFGLPVLLVYGVIRGMDQATPQVIVPQFIGALLGRYYFSKKFGTNWPQYRVVFFAGYGCGVGLVMMLSLGLVFMSKSVFQSTF